MLPKIKTLSTLGDPLQVGPTPVACGVFALGMISAIAFAMPEAWYDSCLEGTRTFAFVGGV